MARQNTPQSNNHATDIANQKSHQQHQWWQIIVGLIAILVAAAAWRWQTCSASTEIRTVLASIDSSLASYSHAYNVLPEDTKDREVITTEMDKIHFGLKQLVRLSSGSLESLTHESELQLTFHTLPIRMLHSLVSHRSGLVKLMLSHRLLDSNGFVTNDLVEAYDKHLGGLTIAPIKELAQYGALWSFLRVPKGHEHSPIEIAVDRDLIEVVKLLLPVVREGQENGCDIKVHRASLPRLSALQLAENNENLAMQNLLREEGNPCLLESTATPMMLRQRDAVRLTDSSAQIDLSSFPPTTHPEPPPGYMGRPSGSGGWRKPAGNKRAAAAREKTKECAVTRIPAWQLTKDLFHAHLSNKRPLILTDALNTSRWTIVAQLSRGAIEMNWSDLNVSAGEIPYGELFASRTGFVTFQEFLAYLDGTRREELRAVAEADPSLPSPQPPFYVFDYKMFAAAGWNVPVNTSSPKPSPSPYRGIVGPNFYQLPSEILKVLNTTSVVSQFFLGGESSGAPAHYHCPAFNMLVYGRKRWWLYPPAVGFYSKLPPLQMLLDTPQSILPPTPPCTLLQNSGDLLFVPSQWSHATVNEQESIGVAIEIDMKGC